MKQNINRLCDIILPTYNGLNYVKECISSILEKTPQYLYHLYIINDNSDSITTRYLAVIAQNYTNVSLVCNDSNLGFLQSCNKGLKHGSAHYLLLMNSDVIVVNGWLERMLECAESDSRIAAVNPLTNHAANINIPMTPGANFYSMDWHVSQITRRLYPDVVTGVGFCMLLRRSALDDVGLFDEIYGGGYCEESDLCMRLTTNGYRTVVADDVYVFHKGSASYASRDARYLENRKIFDQRWREIYSKQFRAFKKEDPLKSLREYFKPPQQWSPLTSMRETYRRIRGRYRDKNYVGSIKTAVRGLMELPFATKAAVSGEFVNKFTRPDRLRITYVLHSLTVAGGVLSVVQLVNELILLGVDARIVALYQYPETEDWKLYTCPIIFKNESDLIEDFPESDIAIATRWTTAQLVANLIKLEKTKIGVYFVQDYESWFYPESETEIRDQVIATYSMLEHKIVKSSWLQKLLIKDGYQSHKIWLGMDLDVFYKKDTRQSKNLTIIAMARPRTPRRGFVTLIGALALIKEKITDIEIVLFGDDLSRQSIPFGYTDKGVITNQDELAKLYSVADIFIDASDFQGFGRSALEAMACHTACILTDVGGVNEYAEDKFNCILVPPRQPEKIAQAIFTLLDDELREKIIREGVKTAEQFSHKCEASKTLAFFKSLVD